MEVTPTLTTATTTNGATRNAEPSNAINADFNTFLTMLTTQLKNQDPTAPVDSSEFAVQIATFSGVEQQMKTNDLLEEVNTRLDLSNLSELAGWVGQEARVAGPAWYDGDAVTLQIAPEARADEAILVVRDAGGTVVSRETAPLSGGTAAWSGVDAEGNPLPSGLYRFELESRANGSVLSTRTVETYGRIVEAQAGADGTVLILEGGVQVNSSDVTALRAG
jgi:flagellar basal-body rod modification protein FlgD